MPFPRPSSRATNLRVRRELRPVIPEDSMSPTTLLEPEAAETATPHDPRTRILETIRALHARNGGLTRIHRTHASLYAQARRAFGSWRDAVAAAGLDYAHERDR